MVPGRRLACFSVLAPRRLGVFSNFADGEGSGEEDDDAEVLGWPGWAEDEEEEEMADDACDDDEEDGAVLPEWAVESAVEVVPRPLAIPPEKPLESLQGPSPRLAAFAAFAEREGEEEEAEDEEDEEEEEDEDPLRDVLAWAAEGGMEEQNWQQRDWQQQDLQPQSDMREGQEDSHPQDYWQEERYSSTTYDDWQQEEGWQEG